MRKITENTFLFGIEAEMEYNAFFVGDIKKDGYHGREKKSFCKGWYAESDGSLRTEKFSAGSTVELISEPFKYRNLDTTLFSLQEEFKKRCKQKRGVKLADYINFNKSCGHHLHVSVGKYKIIPSTSLKIFSQIRSEFFKNLKKEMSGLYPTIRAHYTRKYAKRLSERAYNERYYEFNLTNEEKGIEWRSFNCLGVQTWEEYFKLVVIGINSMKKVLTEYINGEKSFSENRLSLLVEDTTPQKREENFVIEREEELKEETVQLQIAGVY